MPQYCCDRMKYDLEQKCDVHKDRFDCPDALIHHGSKTKEYGLIVHTGGHGFIEIKYCPWCGTNLVASKKKRK